MAPYLTDLDVNGVGVVPPFGWNVIVYPSSKIALICISFRSSKLLNEVPYEIEGFVLLTVTLPVLVVMSHLLKLT
jgi:hypothetical protein